jgi:hypothetical protein
MQKTTGHRHNGMFFFIFLVTESKARIAGHQARVVGYDPFSLRVIHKEGLPHSNGDINRLMIMCYYAKNKNDYTISMPCSVLRKAR